MNSYFFHVFSFLVFFTSSFTTVSGFGIVKRSVESQCLTNFSAVRDPDGKLLSSKKIKDNYQKVYFALRGPLHHRTVEIVEELKKSTSNKSYNEVIRMGIVDSQSIGQKPITFLRQLIALVALPDLMSNPIFPSDVVQRAKELLEDLKGHSTGSSTAEKGITIVRRKVADFISKRDGIPTNKDDIYLTDGVSAGVELMFQVLQQECNDSLVGVLTPSPLYPLYSALLSKYGLVQIKYNLNPDQNWALDVTELKRAYNNATCSCNCKPRALLLINPGNPSGKILRRNAMEEIVKFAHNHNLILLVDEIYQNNLFGDVPFTSMNKVVHEMESPYNKMELISFNSISKGYISEVGLRGGYMHQVNVAKGVHDIMYQLVSIKQCPNVMGQVGLSTLVHPPQSGEPSFDLFNKEVSDYFREHKEIVKILVTELNKLEGYNCSEIEGGPVAFTKFKIPEKAIKEAETRGMLPDIFYGMELLEEVGLFIAVGSAFGFTPSQHYMRISLPVKVADVKEVISRLKTFHEKFLIKYA